MFQTLAESHFDEFVGVVPGSVCLRLSLRACLCLGPVVEGLDLEAANEGALNKPNYRTFTVFPIFFLIASYSRAQITP